MYNTLPVEYNHPMVVNSTVKFMMLMRGNLEIHIKNEKEEAIFCSSLSLDIRHTYFLAFDYESYLLSSYPSLGDAVLARKRSRPLYIDITKG